MIPVMDLGRQYKTIKKDIAHALKNVFERSNYVLGEEVREFEKEFAGYLGVKYAVGVNSGTDALFLALKALGIKAGDEVITCAFGYIASVLGISYCGAKPVLVDVNERDFNIDVTKIEEAITSRTKSILPVHLYGQMCDMIPLMRLARKYNLKVIEDCAQAHGAAIRISNLKFQISNKENWRMAGTIGDVGCYSFYPTKNLGAYGDGGMMVTNDEHLYKKLLLLRDYGRKDRYVFAIKGYNSRLDEMQAALLRLKLKKLDFWNKQRQNIAEKYLKEIKTQHIILPATQKERNHVYHLFVVRSRKREELQGFLGDHGIGSAIHYPIPVHLQQAYEELGCQKGDFPVAERLSREVLTLPMFPELTTKETGYICTTINNFKKG